MCKKTSVKLQRPWGDKQVYKLKTGLERRKTV